MSSKKDLHTNMNDYGTGTPSGTSLFEVVDNVDPEGTGRIQVRQVGNEEAMMDPSQLQWIPVSTPFFAQLRGIGMSPPHSYEKGTIVSAFNTGQQGWIAQAAVPNQRTDDQTADTHPESRGQEHKHSDPTGQAKSRVNEDYTLQSKFPDQDDQPPNVFLARQYHDEGMKTIQHNKGRFKEAADIQQTADRYYRRMQTRNGKVPNSVGAFPFSGDMESATKFMQQVGSPPILDSTFSIIENLQQTARSGQNKDANEAVGGMGNVTAAISAASSTRQQVQQQNEQNQLLDPFEAWLREQYKKQTGKEPVDSKGRETREYTAWKADYIAKLKSGTAEIV